MEMETSRITRTSSSPRNNNELKTLILFTIVLLFVVPFTLMHNYISLMVILMSIAGAMNYISWNRVSNSNSHSPDYIQSGEAGTSSLILLLILVYIPSWPVSAAVITTILLFILEYAIFLPSTGNRKTRFLPGIIILFLLAIFIFYIVREGIYPGEILLWAPFLGFGDLSLPAGTMTGLMCISLLLYILILIVNPKMKLQSYGNKYVELTGVSPFLVTIIISAVRSLLTVLLIITMGWLGALLKHLPVSHRSPTPAGEITAISIIILYLLSINIIMLFFPGGIVLALMILLSYTLTYAKMYLFPRWKVYQ